MVTSDFDINSQIKNNLGLKYYGKQIMRLDKQFRKTTLDSNFGQMSMKRGEPLDRPYRRHIEGQNGRVFLWQRFKLQNEDQIEKKN